MSAEILLTAMAKAGVTTATKEMVSRAMKGWGGSYLAGRKALRHLDSSEGFISYLTKHVSVVNRIRTIHSNEADVFLNDIYYPLTVCDMGSDYDFSNDFTVVKSAYRIDDSFISFDDKLTNIIGIAGQGKSTILRKSFMQSIMYDDKLPIFIELRNAENIGIINSIMKVLKSIGIDASIDVVKEILEANKLSLFLDGFDEVSSDNRAKVLDEIIEINLNYEIKITTSSRPETEICHVSNIKNLKVKKLNKKDVIGIIKKLKSNKPEETNNDAENIIKKIESEDNLSQVMVSPILVTLLYVCYPYMDITPNNHVEFYTDLFNTLYLRHDKLKGYTREKKSTLGNTLAYDSFCAFSFICLQKNHISMKYKDMIDNARLALKNIQIQKPEEHSPENLCDDFVDVTCLIQKDGYQRYSFLHKSICEFHAASFIKEMGMDTKPRFYENILNRIYNDNQEMLNTVIFLKNLDCHDFAKNLTIPLLEKIGVHLWEHPSDKIIDNFLNNTLEGARARVKFIDGKTIVSGLRFKIKNIWINLYEAELESGNRMDVSRVIFNVLWREVLSEPINKHEDGEAKMVDVTSIINDKLRKEIRTELKDIMVFIHKNVYKETKNMIDSSEENMLSLLNIS
ncbi:NACHT domain-containing protein [Citrobacter braakii]|uniref:NACHT domain-containing protein n=1 Tax=Citrobacter braakii TaxID=57706 RepID=UPI002B250822|nr:NACHT domain-containing protein [Citrobacter braakii]MEB2304664.1 NACHT domain-containing protein [Citrobacter braakii]